MTDTPRLGLPLLAAGQAQKEVVHNEALLAIDCRLQSAVVTRGLSEPPPAPETGAMFIVASEATGVWSGRTDSLASWDGQGWRLIDPVVGSLVWVADEGTFAVYDGAWSRGGWPVDGLRVAGRKILSVPPEAVANPIGGANVDSECREALSALLEALKNQGIVL